MESLGSPWRFESHGHRCQLALTILPPRDDQRLPLVRARQ